MGLAALSVLAACGGGNRDVATRASFMAPSSTLYATGPVQRACLAQDRRAASKARCGCVQAVADRALSAGEQRRGVQAFKDPHKLQVWRQSDRASDNAFWRTWKAFGQDAARQCRAT
ncbi:hypothetical protein K3756_14990 [Sulfitobacter sp. S190]|nr:hypothetical protein K3756_14990 [Sulfitobacter sp. S190]